jgi:twitching motility protein PilT
MDEGQTVTEAVTATDDFRTPDASQSNSDELARILLKEGVVDLRLMERAQTIRQTQDRWLGHVLVELGAVAPDEMARALGKELHLNVLDLKQAAFSFEATRVLPETLARRFDALPVGYLDGRLMVAMVNPLDTVATDVISSQTGAAVDMLVATARDVRTGIDRFYAQLARELKLAGESSVGARKVSKSKPGDADEFQILHVEDLLRTMHGKAASDLHLSANAVPTMRIDGELVPVVDKKLQAKEVYDLVYAILTDEQIAEFEQGWELDLAYSVPTLSRFRVNVHRQRGSLGAVFRSVPIDPPTLDALNMPKVLKRLVAKPRGLVLVTGPTGSGKSTTLAAMIREVNVARRCHIVTIEDPIEFLHRNERSIIIQREVGSDTKSFAAALRHVLRQDPDVILIGEMRDLETISTAVTAAETGHLVLATLHTTSAAQTIDRIVDVFPPHQQEQIRVQLSTVLEGVISQTLLPLSDGKGRICAQEIMVASSAVRNLIREGKSHQIQSVIQSGGAEGMQTLDQALKDLVLSAKVTPQVALAAASNPAEFQVFLKMR